MTMSMWAAVEKLRRSQSKHYCKCTAILHLVAAMFGCDALRLVSSPQASHHFCTNVHCLEIELTSEINIFRNGIRYNMPFDLSSEHIPVSR